MEFMEMNGSIIIMPMTKVKSEKVL